MEFVCTYRDRTGAMREKRVEAASRSETVAVLRAQGIVPMRVEAISGAKAPRRKVRNVEGAASRKGAAYVLAVAFVLLSVGGLWWWLARPAETATLLPEKPIPKAIPDEVVVGNSAAEQQNAPRQSLGKSAPKKHGAMTGNSKKIDGKHVVSVVTNDAGFILTTVEENGTTNIITDTLHPPVFKNPMHQLIAAAIAGGYDSEMAPLPLGPGDDIAMREALKVEIKDSPDDTEDVKRLKEAVRATRRDIAALMDQGATVEEILTQHRELWNENVNIRNEMKFECMRLLRDGDYDAAEQYLERINRSFREMGIPEIGADDVQPAKRKKRRKVE